MSEIGLILLKKFDKLSIVGLDVIHFYCSEIYVFVAILSFTVNGFHIVNVHIIIILCNVLVHHLFLT